MLFKGGLHRGFRFLASLWHRQYHDSRIILEQNGDLKYLVVTADTQRRAARAFMVSLAVVGSLIIGMAGTTAYLQVSKMLLKDSQREIYLALKSAGIDPDSRDGEYSADEIREMARAIRERDMQIRQYVGDWTENLAGRNTELRRMMHTAGLNEKVISIIQASQQIGGFSENLQSNSLLGGAFAKEAAANGELRGVLDALPSRMPLGDYSLVSGFGIRQHPVFRRPMLHSGVDLISTSADEKVRAVKAGKVVVARANGNMGNTVLVQHNHGIETLYGHLDKILVKEGQDVAESTVLGTMGDTGQTTGKHLHFEILIGSYQVDPKKVIQTAQHVRKIQK